MISKLLILLMTLLFEMIFKLSGKTAEEAARASKQVLDVMTEEELKGEETPTEPETDLTKKEEAPQTLVIGADGKQIDDKQ